MIDKTELQKACEAAEASIQSTPMESSLSMADIIERHIAPLLRSVRIVAIDECVKRCENESVRSMAEKLQQSDMQEWSRGYLAGQRDAARSISALKEQP